MIDRTVVAWDGTQQAQTALDWAVAREGSRRGPVVIVRVVDDARLEAFSADETDDAIAGALSGLATQVERLRSEAPGQPVVTEIVRGDPRSRLERLSNPETVLVLGTHDRSIKEPRFAWSLSARLVAEARGPLVVVPAGGHRNGTGVVVGVDGSPESDAAASFAAGEAERLATTLKVVHAWLEPAPVTAVGDVPVNYQPWLESSHRSLLDAAVTQIRRTYPALVVVPVLEQSTAAQALERHAESAALLVVGSRGYGPIRGLLLGSVSTSLLGTMPCPVAITGPGYVAALAESPSLARAARV
ncbi:MAG: hypothetical protein JWP75_2895 [Frondihabitans sp.]|nr:hypothetical protein [Frondihabitans sp.]